MTLLCAILYEALLLALGYLTLSLVRAGARCGLVETLGLSQALGAGNMGVILLFASLAGFTPSRPLLGCVAGAVALALAVLSRKRRLVRIEVPLLYNSLNCSHAANDLPSPCKRAGSILHRPSSPREPDPSGSSILGCGLAALGKLGVWDGLLLLLPAGLLLYLLLAVSCHALAIPLYEWDAFGIWGLKAKVLTHEALRANPAYFHDASLSYSHPDYPLLLPFLTSGVYGAMGQVDDRLGKIILPPLFAAFGVIAYLALRWKLPRNQAWFLTAALLALPLCTRWAGAGYADVLLTLFYGGSIFFLVKWLEEDSGADLALAALFSAYGALTKSEGLGLAVINVVVLFAFLAPRLNRRPLMYPRSAGFQPAVSPTSSRQSPEVGRGVGGSQRLRIGNPRYGRLQVCATLNTHRLMAGVWFVVGLVVLLLPWLLWSRNLPRTHEASLKNVVAHLPSLGIIVRAFVGELLKLSDWGGLWLLLVLAAVLGWKALRVPRVLALWTLLALHLGLYGAAYAATSRDLNNLLTFSLDRVLLHVTPAAIYLIGYHWAGLGEGGGGKAESEKAESGNPVGG